MNHYEPYKMELGLWFYLAIGTDGKKENVVVGPFLSEERAGISAFRRKKSLSVEDF